MKDATQFIIMIYDTFGLFFMNFNHIGLGLLGTVSLIAIIGIGLHFQPLLKHYDLENSSSFFKDYLKTLTNPNTNTKNNNHIKETYACLFVFGFFDNNNPIEIMLTDMPKVIQRHTTGITKVKGTVMLKENKIKVFDYHHNDITKSFLNKLIEKYSKHKDLFEKSESVYDFYTQACIPVRYFKYNQKYYIHPH